MNLIGEGRQGDPEERWAQKNWVYGYMERPLERNWPGKGERPKDNGVRGGERGGVRGSY